MERAEKVKRNAQALKKMANAIKPHLPPGNGFILFTFDFGQGGEIGYASDGERSDVIKTLEEFLSNIKKDNPGN